jgi:hypothetical protein
MRRAFVIVIGAAAVAACASLSGLSGAPDDAGAGEAAATDAPIDAADATQGDAGDASGEGGCTHTFCDDFDHAKFFTDGWSSFQNFGNDAGVGSLDTAIVKSPPNSALLMVAANPPVCTFSQLVKVIPGSWKHVSLGFDIRIGDAIGNAPASTKSVGALQIANTCSVVFGPWGSNPNVVQQDDPSGNPNKVYFFNGGIAAGSWGSVVVDFRVDTPPYARISTSAGGNLEIDALAAKCNVKGEVKIQLGPHCSDGFAAPFQTRFDNVTIDVE